MESALHGLTCDCFPHFCNLNFVMPASRPYSWAIWDFWFNGSMFQSICDRGAVQSAVCLSECLAAISVFLLGATRHFVLFLCKICAEIVVHRMFAASLNGLNKETKGQRNPGAGPPCTILEANTSPATLKKNLNFWRTQSPKISNAVATSFRTYSSCLFRPQGTEPMFRLGKRIMSFIADFWLPFTAFGLGCRRRVLLFAHSTDWTVARRCLLLMLWLLPIETLMNFFSCLEIDGQVCH